jgi:hypothetical protein
MDSDEMAELGRYIRERLRDVGRVDLDDRLRSPRGQADIEEEPIEYLLALRREAVLGTERLQRETMSRLSFVSTARGEPPDGVVVEVSEQDRDIYGAEQIPLVGSQLVDRLVQDIDDLIERLREDRTH